MQNAFTYQGSKIQEQTGCVAESNASYMQSYLDAQTEVFSRRLKIIEQRSVDPGENRDELFTATTKAIIDMSFACEEYERRFAHDKDAVQEAQADFRERTDALISKSYFMNRARTWPRGYQGDYLLLEGVYRNITLSAGLGLCLDRHSLSTTLSIAVRERLRTLTALLAAQLALRKGPRVLNIACGSCREVFDLSSEIRDSGARMACVDFDSEALDFSATRMVHAGIPSDQLIFRKYNAIKMINSERNLKEFGMQDVIYSAGFFDYLQDHVLIPLLQALYDLLNSGGTLIAPFKDSRRYRTPEYHWFIKWDGFHQRTEEDIWMVFEKASIPCQAIRTVRDGSGVILFFEVTKP